MASKAVLTDLDFQGAGTLVNIRDAASAQEPVSKAQLDAAVEGIAWKDNVAVATQANLNLASPGSTIDGVTMAANDRVLVRAQTAGAENGIYIWNGAAVPMTRSADASTWAELKNARVPVDGGTSAQAVFQNTTFTGTLDTTAIVFANSQVSAPAASETTAGVAEVATQAETDTGTDDTRMVSPAKLAGWAGRKRKHSQDIGDGSALSYVVTHGFNTRDVVAQLRLNSGTYPVVDAAIEIGLNDVTVRFNAAPALNAYRLTVIA